jgi:hypothetical protein
MCAFGVRVTEMYVYYGLVQNNLTHLSNSTPSYIAVPNTHDHAISRAVWGVGLRPLVCWDCGFESRRGHERLSLVSVSCCQVEVSATGWSLVQSGPTECGLSECDREASTIGVPDPLGLLCRDFVIPKIHTLPLPPCFSQVTSTHAPTS